MALDEASGRDLDEELGWVLTLLEGALALLEGVLTLFGCVLTLLDFKKSISLMFPPLG